jgi:hypothetical protein
MFRKNGNHYRSIDNARSAVRAGDTAATERWLRIADRLLSIEERKERRQAQRTKPNGPVMLDPKGFSPGGQPNWYLNQKHLERAGLDK